MCKICDGFNGTEEVCNEIESASIGIGDIENVWALELWLMVDPKDDRSEDPRLNVAFTETSSGCDISAFNVHIKYCPFCGREL